MTTENPNKKIQQDEYKQNLKNDHVGMSNEEAAQRTPNPLPGSQQRFSSQADEEEYQRKKTANRGSDR